MDNNAELEVEVEVEDTLASELAAAWDASESTDEEAPEPIEAGPSDEAPPATNEAPTQDVLPSEKAAAADPDAAPVGLPPEAREAWKDTPPAVKAALAKREADYANGIKQYAEGAKRAAGMDKALAPYAQFFAMNGGANKVLPTLLQTGSVLQMGSGQQKAEAVAGIIKQYGIDIRALDNFLVGAKPPPEQQQQAQMDAMFNQRLAPMQQQLQHYQQRDQQQAQEAQQGIATEVDAFQADAKNEFYNDLRGDMADLMDMAANRGQNMNMQQAYDKACAMNPTISQIITSRQGQQNVAGKRRAASSIHGGPGGAGGAQAHDSMRSAIEDAWENAGRT
jgi:hypothetical protein